jgi:hypothetical protein
MSARVSGTKRESASYLLRVAAKALGSGCVYFVYAFELSWLKLTQMPSSTGMQTFDDYISFDVLVQIPTNSSINYLETDMPSFNHRIKKIDGKVDIRKLEFKGYLGNIHSEVSLNNLLNTVVANLPTMYRQGVFAEEINIPGGSMSQIKGSYRTNHSISMMNIYASMDVDLILDRTSNRGCVEATITGSHRT